MESVAGMVDAWLWLDELAIFEAASKNTALHVEEGVDRLLWKDENDNWAMVSDDSEYFQASSLLGVAGMVAEWLSLGERLGFQFVSRIISFQLK